MASNGTESLAAREKAKLKRSLGRGDLILFTACAIVAVDTLSATTAAGGQAITWLLVSFALFLVPYGLLVAELGAAFPAEGGAYEWSRLAFGRFAGAITAVMYWVSNPIWIGGTLSATSIGAIDTFILSPHHQLGTWSSIAFGLVYTWLTVTAAIVGIRYGKWIPNVGTILKGVLIAFFGVLTVVYLIRHGHTGNTGFSQLAPTTTGFLGVIGLLMFNWVGFEVTTGASEEMVDPQRDIPAMIVRSGLLSAALYAVLIVSILLVIPQSGLSNVGGFSDAYQTVASVLGGGANAVGDVVGVVIVLTLFVSGATWLIGSDRVQAIAALDGAAPSFMGRFGTLGTPVVVNLLSGLVASAFVFFVFYFTSGSLANFFAVMIALVISTTAVSYVFVFPALPVLRRRYPDVARPYRVPGGLVGCWVCALLTEFFAVVTAITLIWPGLIDGLLGQTYSIRDSWGVSRTFFEWVTLGTFAAILVLGVVFWLIGRVELRHGVVTDDAYTVAAPETAGA